MNDESGSELLQTAVTLATLANPSLMAGWRREEETAKLVDRTCTFCGSVRNSPADLQRHLRKHTGERPFKCERCPKAFKAKRSLQYHLHLQHADEDEDEVIKKKIKREDPNLSSEQLDEMYDRKMCGFCAKRCEDRQDLLSHVRLHIDSSSDFDGLIEETESSSEESTADGESVDFGDENEVSGVEAEISSDVLYVKTDTKFNERIRLQRETVVVSRLDGLTDSGRKVTLFRCHLCGRIQGSLRSLHSHLAIHSGKIEIGKNKEEAEDSGSGSITVPENYKPDSVVVKIVDGEEVKYSRYNGAFVCRFCPKAFYRLFSLQRHERTHTGHKPCSCPVCCRKFSEPRNLRAHMLRFHEGHEHCLPANSRQTSQRLAPVSNDMLKKTENGREEKDEDGEVEKVASSVTLSRLIRPQISSLPLAAAPFFTTLGSHFPYALPLGINADNPLLNYIASATSVSTPVSTTVSSTASQQDAISVSKSSSLSKTHSRLNVVRTPVSREDACKPIQMSDGRTVFRCTYCNKDFGSYSDINRHMDFHEDVRPYKCKFCDYFARTNSQLKVHLMRHQGIREFHCKLCNYKGVTQSDLNRHTKSQIHMLKSQNACKQCGEGFVSPKNLDKHTTVCQLSN